MENYEQEFYEEEQGVTFGEVMGVLFGRKLLLLIVTLSVFIVDCVGILFYNARKSTYVGMYDYYVSGLSEGVYVDGSKFDVRDLITLDKLNKYKAENEELANVDMNVAFRNGGIQYLKYTTIYRKNETKLNEEDNDYVVDKTGFRIVLKKRYFTFAEAQALTKAIANEANVITKEKIDSADYKEYLALYNQSIIYDNQISYLESQYNLLTNKYASLISNYNDGVLENGKKLSDVQLMLKEYFQNVSFDALRVEMSLNGYVKDYTIYETQIQKQIEALNREKAVDTNKKEELINQRDALLAAAGSLYSVELSAYNDQIIQLSNRIFDIDEEVALLNQKLNNKGREENDAVYKQELEAFKENLTKHYNELVKLTDEYTAIEKEVVKKHATVYFDDNNIVAKENAINVTMFLAIAAVGSFFVGVLVNLCVDGKKLTKKYHEEHANN